MSPSELNPRQREAVEHIHGPLLLLAGAGAGKTRVITHRIAHLIKTGINPAQILALAFTNRATGEMSGRVEKLLASPTNQSTPKRYLLKAIPFISTFHSLGVTVLKEFGAAIGVPKWFSIYDRSDSRGAMKRAMKFAGVNVKETDPGKILSRISREKGQLMRQKDFAAGVDDFYSDLVAKLWYFYEDELETAKALDFDDLLLKTFYLLKVHRKILNILEDRFRHILVDEFQDTNDAQYEIVRLLASGHRNLAVVGDMDQTIYTWRGANAGNMLRFEDDFPERKLILLEENYRSTKKILSAANEVIKKNKLRQEKNLYTSGKEGEPITIIECLDEIAEANFVAGKIKELANKKVSYSEIALLYRANFQSRAFEESLAEAKIPYHIIGTGFFERREVKDVLAYLRAALNPDDKESLRRIINVPRRGIGEKTIEKIMAGKEADLPPRVRENYAGFKKILAEIQIFAEKEVSSKVIKLIIQKTGLEKEYLGSEEGEERIGNIREVATLASRYDKFGAEGIENFLTDVLLATDQDSLSEDKKGVRLLTVHAAKGLEFEYVFVVGLEQGLFPHEKLFADDKSDPEEERRLFYVALTRAKEKVFLSHTALRTLYGKKQLNIPSEFILDIPPDLIEPEIPRGPHKNLLPDIIDF